MKHEWFLDLARWNKLSLIDSICVAKGECSKVQRNNSPCYTLIIKLDIADAFNNVCQSIMIERLPKWVDPVNF